MTIEIDGKKVTVFDQHGKELDLGGITAIKIRCHSRRSYRRAYRGNIHGKT